MKRLIWWLDSLSWAVPVGLTVVLLAAAAALHVFQLQPLQQRLSQLESRSTTSARVALRAGQSDPTRLVNAFYDQFATGDSLSEHLARIHQVAQAQGITLQQGDYKMLRERDARLTRYQIVLPVQGPYIKVRRFVASTLETIPVAALDQVSFERKRIDDGLVDAQVRFTLYLPNHEVASR